MAILLIKQVFNIFAVDSVDLPGNKQHNEVKKEGSRDCRPIVMEKHFGCKSA